MRRQDIEYWPNFFDPIKKQHNEGKLSARAWCKGSPTKKKWRMKINP